MRYDELQIAAKLIADALAAGYSLSVHDSEDWAVERSTDFWRILTACASTDEDRLYVHTPTGTLGWVYLVYGNEPGVLIADYVDNPELRALVKGAEALAETLEEDA